MAAKLLKFPIADKDTLTVLVFGADGCRFSHLFQQAYRRAEAGDKAAVVVLEELVDARLVKWCVDPKPLRAAADEFVRQVEQAISKAKKRKAEDAPEE